MAGLAGFSNCCGTKYRWSVLASSSALAIPGAQHVSVVPLQRVSPGQAVVADQRDRLLHRSDRGPGAAQLGDPGVAGSGRIAGIGARRQARDQVIRRGQGCLDLADRALEPGQRGQRPA